MKNIKAAKYECLNCGNIISCLYGRLPNKCGCGQADSTNFNLISVEFGSEQPK